MKTKKSNSIKMRLRYLVAIAVLLLTISAGMPENDFRILKSRNGIDLYYRWMDMPGGNRVRQMKAVLNVDANTEDVITLLKDEERALHWISSAEKFQHLDTASHDEWVSYIQFSVPWPLADQDCILEFARKEKANGEVVVEFNCNPGYITEVDGMKRMTDINGCFVLKPCDKGDCILECYFLSSKASVIPRWITEPIITGNILNMMEALRDELNEV